MKYVLNNSRLGFRTEVELYVNYMGNEGYLTECIETHALWHYYTTAQRLVETRGANLVELEGDYPEEPPRYRQLFKSIALLYGVRAENMSQCWAIVDAQARRLGLPLLEDSESMRFNRSIILSGE